VKKAIIVSFEGIDGCGKTTQAKKFVRYLRNRKRRVLFLREPGTTQLGKDLRRILLARKSKLSNFSELFLYLAARSQLCREILDRQSRIPQIIVLDRFADSTVAYQGHGRGIPISFIDMAHQLVLGGLTPDITFLIDARAEDLRTTLRNKGTDRLERSLAFQRKVRKGYLKLAAANPQRFRIIHRTPSQKNTFAQICAVWESFNHGQKKG